MKVAVIPARGGSKRIPNKCIKSFCGKPILAWTIEAAQQSKCFDRIIVSTDSKEISEVAIKFGAEVPFIRPTDLADDYASTISVISHAIHEVFSNQEITVCSIYPTAPFIQKDDIIKGLSLLRKNEVSFVIAITCYPHPTQRAFEIDSQGDIKIINLDNMNKRTQDLETRYHDAGQFIWGKSSSWLSNKDIFSSKNCGVIIPCYRVYDIDTADDWQRAEYMFRQMKLEHNS